MGVGRCALRSQTLVRPRLNHNDFAEIWRHAPALWSHPCIGDGGWRSAAYASRMPRFLIGWFLGLGGTAIGLVIAALILGENFQINGAIGFIVSLIVFAILSAFFTWLVFKFLVRNAGSVVALTGLISTFLALFVTSVFTSGLDINGWGWIWGTLIVWALGMFIWLIPGPWRDYAKERT